MNRVPVIWVCPESDFPRFLRDHGSPGGSTATHADYIARVVKLTQGMGAWAVILSYEEMRRLIEDEGLEWSETATAKVAAKIAMDHLGPGQVLGLRVSQNAIGWALVGDIASDAPNLVRVEDLKEAIKK